MEVATVAFRTLRTRLIFSSALSEVRTLAVTSPVGGEGKTTTAANLALSLARQGTRVLLVDGHLAGVSIAAMFQVPAEPGLAELLADTVSVEEVIRPTLVNGLFVLPRGATVADSAELLGRSRLDKVLQAVAGMVDLVVIDTPPILTVPDASVIAARVDRVLLVLRAGRSDRSLAHAALQQLDAIGAHVIGAVLNDPDAKVAAHGEDAWVYAHAR